MPASMVGKSGSAPRARAATTALPWSRRFYASLVAYHARLLADLTKKA